MPTNHDTNCVDSASCSVSKHFNQIDCLQWTHHLQECVELLKDRRDEPSDTILVFQARLHHIAQKAADAHKQKDGSSPATMLYLSALRDQLWEVQVPESSNPGLRGKIDQI